MAESLSQLQGEFTQLIAKLIEYAYAQGYTMSFGEAWRTPEQAQWDAEHHTGIVHSVHIDRLAVDFNLFKNGVYLDGTENHRPLGEWWEKQHPLARWGGRFNDGNHYSFEYNGVK